MEMRRPEVKFTLRSLYLQTKSFLPPLPTSCIVRKNEVFYTNYGHIIFPTDRIIFHKPFLVTACNAFYCCCKILPLGVHHIKFDICGFLTAGYSIPLWVGVQVFTSTYADKVVFWLTVFKEGARDILLRLAISLYIKARSLNIEESGICKPPGSDLQ